MNDSTKERLLDDLVALIEEAEDLLDHGADATGDALQQAQSSAREKLRSARDRLMKFEKGVVKDTDRYVRGHRLAVDTPQHKPRTRARRR